MIRHRTLDEVKQYNWFKAIVTIILLLLLLVLSLRQCGNRAATDGTGVVDTGATAVNNALPTLDTPTVTGLPDDGIVEVGTLPLTGTGTPGSTIYLTAAGRELGQAVVDSNGRWQADINLDEAGDYEIQFEARDDQGQVVEGSPFQLTIPEPVIEIMPPTLTLPEGDLQPGSLALSGLGTPGSMVDILVDGLSVGTAEVGDDGTWSLDLTLDDPGNYDLGVRALDLDGQVAVEGDNYSLDLTLPTEIPTINLPEPLSLGDLTLEGTGTPGSTIEVLLGDRSLGTAVVGADGSWTLDTTFSDPGDYTITAQAIDDGQAIETSAETAISIAAPTAPTIEIAEGEQFLPGTIQLSGQGEPGTTVEILLDGESIGTVAVDVDGRWQLEGDFDTAGQYELGVRTVNDSGEILVEGESSEITIYPARFVVGLPDFPNRAGRFSYALQGFELPEGLGEDESFTLFAPTDSAFQQLPESVLDALLNNPEILQRLVSHHIVAGTIELGDEPQTLATLAGTEITLQPTEAGHEIDGARIADSVEGDNGRVYFVDNLLVPTTEGIRPPTIDESGVPIYKGPFLTVVGDAEPGTTLVLLINGEQVGTTTVAENGFWLVEHVIEDGRYVIVAYLLNEDGLPLITSKPIILVNPGPLAE